MYLGPLNGPAIMKILSMVVYTIVFIAIVKKWQFDLEEKNQELGILRKLNKRIFRRQ
jgi:hypothetical protein